MYSVSIQQYEVAEEDKITDHGRDKTKQKEVGARLR